MQLLKKGRKRVACIRYIYCFLVNVDKSRLKFKTKQGHHISIVYKIEKEGTKTKSTHRWGETPGA